MIVCLYYSGHTSFCAHHEKGTCYLLHFFYFRYGRRFTWLACTVLLFTSGIIAPFIRHYWLHVCCRFVTAMAVSGTTTTAFVICMFLQLISLLFHL